MASRKSERLMEQQTPQITLVKKKPKNYEKPNIQQTPLRRSERGKKDISNSLESMFFAKGANSFEENRKNPKEKSLNMLNVDEKKDGFVRKNNQESRGVKRRKINGKSFRALFLSQETKKIGSADGPSEVDCDVSQLSDSKLMEPRDEEGDKSLRELVNDTEEECLKGFEEGVVILASDSQSSVAIISRDVGEADLSNSRSRGSTEKGSNKPPDVAPSVATNVVGETLTDNTCFSAEFSQELVNDSEEECLKGFEDGVVILASDSQSSVAIISRDVGEADLSNSRSRSSTEKGSNEPPDMAPSVAANVVGETLTDNTCFSAEFSPELEIVESDSIGVSEGFNALKNSNQSLDSKNPEPSKFVEYWVPVQISNLQLEQYCATLLSNSVYLCSCSKNDIVGTHHEILNTIRKCCDHPYLVDSTLQGSITKGLPLSDILDAGIKASGKLQLLDMILSEIKARQLRVLILFQPIVGSAIPIGEILEDFVSQRFGQNSYERVDKHHHTKKQAAALNRFNKKESGQFVFLLEKGACVPSIKLSSVDTVVMFDSDWNAGNDLKALQKLSIDTQFPQIKVFRLYSVCTSEEKALILAKQDIHLDNNLQNISCINTGTLLSWGASNLFDRLEEFHASKSRSMFVDIACEDLLANNVLREFQAILTAESGLKDPENSLIAKVWQLRGVYCTNFPLLGESKIQSAIGEEPHIFWKNLLAGRSPCWRYPCSMSRNRKRVQNFDGPSKEQEIDSDSVKKHRKVIDNGVNSSPHKEPAAGHKIRHENQSLPVPAMGSGISSPSPASSLNSHDNTYLPEGNQDQSMERFISNEQKSIHNYLTAQMEKLCEILAFEENMKSVLHLFLGYVVENHRVSKENVAIFQALQISLCWIAASMLKKKIDRQESLKLAKQKINFECSDEQADCIYKMLRRLKRTFLQQPNIIKKLQALINPTSTEEHVLKDILDAKTLESMHIRSENQETAHEENLTDLAHAQGEQSYNHESRKKSILCEKQQEEIDEFHKRWEDEKLHLEKKKSVRAAFTRQIHSHNIDVRTENLKMLDTEFSRKLEEHKKLMEAGLKELKAKHLSAKYRETESRISDEVLVCNFPTTRLSTFNEEERTSVLRDEEPIKVVCPSFSFVNYQSERHPKSDRETHEKQPSTSNVLYHNHLLKGIDSENTVTSNGESHDKTFPGGANESDDVQEEVRSIDDPDTDTTVIQSTRAEDSENKVVGSDSPDLLVNQTDDANGTDPSSDQATLVAHSHEAIDSVNHAISTPLRQVQGEDQPNEDNLPDFGEFVESENVVQLVTTHNLTTEAGVASSEPADNRRTAETNYPTCFEKQPPSVEYLPLGSDSCGSASQSFSDGCTPFQATETTHQVEEPPNHSQHQPQVRETLGPSSSSDIRNPMIENNRHNQPPAGNQGGEPSSGLFVSPHRDVQAVVVDNGLDQRINEVVLQAASQLRLSNSRISSQADPLQIELEKLCKEIEEATKGHENLKSQLRSDCEKEIEEVVSEIRNKYKAKVQDAEAMFQLKKKALHSNVHKVSLNKILADGISAECTKSVDVWPSGAQRQQVMSSDFMHQIQQIPLQLTRGRSNVGLSSAVNTIYGQQATSLTLPGEPRLATPQVGASSRPPIINSISCPQTNARLGDFRAVAPHLQSARADVRAVAPHLRPSGADIRVEADFRAAAPHLQSARADVRAIAPHLRPAGAYIRAAAPHLQTIRPPVSVPDPSHSSLPHNQPSRTLPSQVLHVQPEELLLQRSSSIRPSEPSPRIPLMPAQVRLPLSQTSGPHISLSGSQIVGPASHHSTRPSELELLRDIDRRFKAVLPNPMVQGSVPSTIVSTDVVYLSDDE